MLSIFLFTVFFSITISALCSLMEAALYATPLAYVKHLEKSGTRVSKILHGLKVDISKPISAILILNTISNTAGAAVAGWAAAELWGEAYLLLFSALFTLSILYLSEITPKIAGVVFCKEISIFVAYPLFFLVKLFSPLIYLSDGIGQMIKRKEWQPSVSHHEVLTMAAIGASEGSLDNLEGEVISNVITLDKQLVRDVLTPRVVVFRLDEKTKCGEIKEQILDWEFSRVPLFSDESTEQLSSYVMQRDVYKELLLDRPETTLGSISRPLETVPELMSVDKLLMQMCENKEHICAVVDEYGALAGIISLEDILEEVLGQEIVDEYDSVSDMRTFARLLKIKNLRRRR